jgi:hypothetical protein
LLGPLPPEMRHDTAFMDRLHAYLPGWDVPKLKPDSSRVTSASSATFSPSACVSSGRTRGLSLVRDRRAARRAP